MYAYIYVYIYIYIYISLYIYIYIYIYTYTYFTEWAERVEIWRRRPTHNGMRHGRWPVTMLPPA